MNLGADIQSMTTSGFFVKLTQFSRANPGQVSWLLFLSANHAASKHRRTNT